MSEIKRLQKIILNSALDICNICEANDIPYFIIGGTQLGAIRHKGFIPWDDDFDIGMKREDYEHFIEICDSQLDIKKYFLQTQKTEENYAFAFCKVQLRGTELIEEFSKNVPISHGIFVDVFPYDNLPDNKIKRKGFLIISHIIKNMLWIKCGYGTETQKKEVKYKVLKVLSKMFSVSYIKRIQYKWVTKYNNKSTKARFACDYPKQHLLNEWIDDLSEYKFEDASFWGIKNYDAYLKMMYGDYMVLPPVDKRVQHSYQKINFGKFYDDENL